MRLTRISPVLIALSMVLCLPAIGSCSLVIVTVSNTATSYSATLLWSSPAFFDTISNIGGPTPWSVSTSASGGLFEVTTTQHQVPTPGPSLGVRLLGLSPGSGSASGSDSAAHGSSAHDVLSVQVRPFTATESKVFITAAHVVPEPTTGVAWIFSVGSLALAGLRRFRQT